MGNADLVKNWFDRDRVPRMLGEPGEPEVATGGETGAKDERREKGAQCFRDRSPMKAPFSRLHEKPLVDRMCVFQIRREQ